MVIYPNGIAPAAPLADVLRADSIDRGVIRDAGKIGYLQRAIHSAKNVGARLRGATYADCNERGPRSRVSRNRWPTSAVGDIRLKQSAPYDAAPTAPGRQR